MNISRREALVCLGAALMTRPGFASFKSSTPIGHAADDGKAFLAAVKRGDLAAVEKMLGRDARLARVKDDAGRSALVIAGLEGHHAVAKRLRETGLELDIVEAVLARDWKRMNALGKANPALCNQAHPIGGTPLYAAAITGTPGLWRLRSLGCEPDARPKGGSGFTPARGAMEARSAAGALISATNLLSNGSDVNAAQRGADSVLHGAVRRRDERLVRLVIRKGASVDSENKAGQTPMALAAELDWKDGVELLKGHARLPRDNRGSRFAMNANREPIVRPDLSDVPRALQSQVTGSSHGQLARVKGFIAKDRRLIYSISSDDELPIEACAHTGNRPIIRFHLDHGAPFSLPTAASLGDLNMIRHLLKTDPTLIHERGAHDFPVMHFAAVGGGDIDVAELLQELGCGLDQESQGNTALHWCVKRNATGLARWLIEEGAAVDPVGYMWNETGETPLSIARAMKRTRMIKILVDGGAQV